MSPRLAALIILLAAALPRIYFAATLALNPDEAWHADAGITGNTLGVLHPPLFHYLSGGFAQLSASELGLRLPHLLAGILSPLLVLLWLRRSFPLPAAFLGALLLALSPSYVLLSIQIRGYSLAICFALLALWTFEDLFHPTRRAPAFMHAFALGAGLCSEYAFGFLAFGLGIAGLMHIAAERPIRPLVFRWVSIQCIGLIALIVLYIYYVQPQSVIANSTYLDLSYLSPSFPRPDQNFFEFALIGIGRLFQFLASSRIAGVLAILVALAGVLDLARSRRFATLVPLAATLLAVVSAALLHVYPLNSSRHHAAEIVLFLFPIAAGLALLFRLRPYLPYLYALLFIAAALQFPFLDQLNPAIAAWRKSAFLPPLASVRTTVPDGAYLITDKETRYLLRYYWTTSFASLPNTSQSNIRTVLDNKNIAALRWDWESTLRNPASVRSLAAELLASKRPVYLLDTGFSTLDLSRENLPGLVQPIIHEPGTLFFARLLPLEPAHNNVVKP